MFDARIDTKTSANYSPDFAGHGLERVRAQASRQAAPFAGGTVS